MPRQTHVTTKVREPVLAVRLTAEQRLALRRIAKSENRTVSGEVRHLIDRRIAEVADTDADERAAA